MILLSVYEEEEFGEYIAATQDEARRLEQRSEHFANKRWMTELKAYIETLRELEDWDQKHFPEDVVANQRQAMQLHDIDKGMTEMDKSISPSPAEGERTTQDAARTSFELFAVASQLQAFSNEADSDSLNLIPPPSKGLLQTHGEVLPSQSRRPNLAFANTSTRSSRGSTVTDQASYARCGAHTESESSRKLLDSSADSEVGPFDVGWREDQNDSGKSI